MRRRKVSEKFTVLAIDEFKFSMLGKSTEVPCFNTIMGNLILTAGIPDDDLCSDTCDLYPW